MKTRTIQRNICSQAMATSTVFGLDSGGGGSFSTVTVSTPFSHLAVMAAGFASSGSRNFRISLITAFLSRRKNLHDPSSSPSSLFLFPLLFTTSTFSSSNVTCQCCVYINESPTCITYFGTAKRTVFICLHLLTSLRTSNNKCFHFLMLCMNNVHSHITPIWITQDC